ncbi:MAG: bifunctional demethylmenaquinone methyltransferase/2-methoxy-6-polyprenyl-1,4-benzoquinol methylase UbiE [Clostridium sp.]|nr:bifunctional demethylmenaquinone methyltransferase/2-methoxy-6-polyprenyl-1,4-benzoquinol methylase UbiE [Clostridium sp.]
MQNNKEITSYKGNGHKTEHVKHLFDNIAHSYDLLNHVLSLGIDRRWRRKAIDLLRPFHPEHILDIATGTGDFAILAARRLHPQIIVGADISEDMMSIARKKIHDEKLEDVIRLHREDCMKLTFPDNTFDAVTISYGARNFEDLRQGLYEIHRVLKPGGHLLLVELSTPDKFPMKQLFAVYARLIMPLIGRIISGDNSAYTYLPHTMAAFPQGENLRQILMQCGFSEVYWKDFMGGISTQYLSTK